ncbi:class I SAM-dependent methyltransferase [Paeniglutamicibacter sp. Y32M11]|uniref:class I SAM-dependent methyltransferase n=1 Tax=Paeniglutamicibacter sp. Y32M11 TaxID=2853258 RepID=UPI001C5311B3|nr:SAM-dependent methyltransferase [Paeniglutamicibacter sp. Y32M11]QXQ11352.1 SAM-dependent methyltransferase [Paeniglutamicibacter sp. Y32M11]
MTESVTNTAVSGETAAGLPNTLRTYLRRFTAAANEYDGSIRHAAELEELLADYSRLVTDPGHEAPFALFVAAAGTDEVVEQLRTQSARCVAVIEKYRALRLLAGTAGAQGYFANIESCITEEFGAVAPRKESKVMLVGSGSFPMTLLNISALTGASTLGIDIDAESINLGRRVVALLGEGLDIALEETAIHELDFISEATHIVISSTVSVKYELLHQMHPLTREDVVVAMRFGDGLKSLFNYPMQEVDPALWRLAETIRRPEQVFDIACT